MLVMIGKPPLNSDFDIVDFVSSFIYLSSTLTDYGDLIPDIKCRYGLGSAVMHSFDIIAPPSRRQKLHIYNVLILSILFYGTYMWLLIEILDKRINSFNT